MFDLFGSGMPLAARFFIAFLVVLALIGVTAWLVRRFGTNRLGGSGARGRQPRLAVIDAASVDGRRRLVLIRRDNIEHLLMIGGPTDVVIEPNIVRATPARDMGREPARSEPALRAPPPPAQDTAWPLQPSHEPAPAPPPPPVAPVTPPRAFRSSAIEEPWLPGEPGTRPASEPGARPRSADTLTDLAAELSSKLAPPEEPAPRPRQEAPPRPELRPEPRPDAHVRQEPKVEARPEPTPPPSEPPPSPQSDRNLTDMARQLEAALRRAPEPRPTDNRPPVTDPFALPPAAPRDFRPRAEPRFDNKSAPKSEPKHESESQAKSEPKPEPEPKFEPNFEPNFVLKGESKPEPTFEAEPKPAPKPAAKADNAKQDIYDNLEEEMASLLGRPPGKS